MPSTIQDHSYHLLQASDAIWTRFRSGWDGGEMEYNLSALSDVEVLLQNQLLIISNHHHSCWRVDRGVDFFHKTHPITNRFDLMQSDEQM